MLRTLLAAASLLVAADLGVATGVVFGQDRVPESVTNRKIRQMNQLREERREALAEGEGAYSDYSIPDPTRPGSGARGYYSSRGGSAPANAGGNAFGNQAGSAFPSDGGTAFPAVPPNK